MNEDDLRELLKERADDFHPHDRDLEATVRRARGLQSRALARLSATTVVVLTIVVGSSLVFDGSRQSGPGRAAGKPSVAIQEIRLADYYEDDGNGTNDEAPSREEIARHVACMREQGFELPDPTRTEDGWMISVPDEDRFDIGSERWREAAFVTCAPPVPPGNGDLVVPLVPEQRIEEFRSCMAGQGFQLPEPISTDSSWRFEGRATNFGDERWRRALFLTCSLDGEGAGP